MAQSNFEHFMREFGNNVRTLKTLKGAEKAEIMNVVEDYHRQREKGEDGISTTTQTMWYANRLSRNALERHGLCMSETYQCKDPEAAYVSSIGDGNHKRISYTSPYIRTKTFYRQQKAVYQCRDVLQEKYILADTDYENSKTRYCDNCGGLIDMSKGYQGCPYCGTAIRIKETHNKIMTVSRVLSGDWYRKWIMIATIVLLFIFGVISGYLEYLHDGTFEYGYAGAIVLILIQAAFVAVIAGFIPGIILTNIILVPVICSIEQSEGRISKIGYEMRKRDSNFSATEIYGTIQAYTKLWFLANNKTEMGCVSKVQYNQDEGIVDVDCLGLKKVRCWEENGYSYIEAKLLVRYITICGEKLAKKRTKTLVTLRRRQGITSSIKVEALKCSCCGANIDILNGACIACGNSMDVEYYDWILYDIRNV
ncbi:MAG: hypothetical protein J6L77_11070 [Coprococcus sp.]|nr:hypothetical protein [Coprococcus sp.]